MKLDTAIASPPPTIQRIQEMKFGAEITATGTRFRLWAPDCEVIDLRIIGQENLLRMERLERGWHELEVPGTGHGTRYLFVLADGTEVPDPASRYQPEDVHGPSEVVDPRLYPWRDIGWRGRPWEEAVIYELHVGTFSEEGTFLGAIDKLDHLVQLGITAIELLPLADFPGRWNWGYDGTLLFAPDSSYGRPEDLKTLIDAAHARNLMVFLDVVYNHFGPEGNYMAAFAPILTGKHETPWGAAVNFDDSGSAMVRDFVMANARYWLNEFRFDGLRFDAVHAIQDSGPKHLLQDMSEQLRASTDGRHIHLILENSDNHAGWMKRHDDARPAFYTAQWNDDVHHCLHTAATGEDKGYYGDYAGRLDLLGRSLAEGFAYQGEVLPSTGEPKGEPSAFLPATAFVSFIQNHDQIGNRPLGDRLGSLAGRAELRALAAVYLLAPQIPMLFQGEEWDARQPFFYFSDLGPDLADSIRENRKIEFRDFYDNAPPDLDPPDPISEDAFRTCKLAWADRHAPAHAEMLVHYRRLLEVRFKEIVPRLGKIHEAGSYEVIADRGLRVRWPCGPGEELVLTANLSGEPVEPVDPWPGRPLWAEGTAGSKRLEPWSVTWSLTDNGAEKTA